MWRALPLIVLVCFGGCGDDGLNIGLSGCETSDAPPFVESPENTVENGVNGVLTAAGVDLLIRQRELLARFIFDVDAMGWVQIELPTFDFGQMDGLGVGIRDVAVGFDLRAVDLGLAFLADPTRIRLTIRDARLRLDDGVVWLSVGGDVACGLGNGIDPGTDQAALVEADLTIDLFLDVDAEGRFQIRVEVLPFQIHALDFELIYRPELPECADGAGAAECRLGCGVGDLAFEIGEALYEAFEDQLNAVVQPVIEALVNALLGRFTDQPLFLEGAVHPRVLSGLLPTATDAHPLNFKVAPTPEGFVIRPSGAGDGAGLTLDVGLDVLDHPCVPPAGTLPELLAGPAPSLTGYDDDREYHLALALSEAVVNRAVWTAYRGGVLCAALDTDQVEALLGQRVDTSTLALLLPGLAELTGGPRPILVALDPAFEAADFPLATFESLPDDGVPQAGLSVSLPRLGLSFYGLVEERWSRLFQAQVDVGVDLVVQATPDNQLALAVDTPRIENVSVTYNELLPGANVPALLDLVVNLATGALFSDGLAFDVGLDGLISGATGLPLDAKIGALRVEGERDDFLSVLLQVVPSLGGAAIAAVETEAEVLSTDDGVLLRVRSSADEALYQWRLDRGPWRPLRAAAGELRVRDPGLSVLGDHEIAVRSVAVGEYRSLDPTPAVVPVEVAGAASAPEAVEPSSGCGAAPGGTAFGWWWLLLLGFRWGPGVFRRWRARRRLGASGGDPRPLAHRSLPPPARSGLGALRASSPCARPLAWWGLAVGACVLCVGAACSEKKAAARAACDTSAECPSGQVCVIGECRVPTACTTSEDCCAAAECQAGACVPPAAECAVAADCLDPNFECAEGLCLRRACDGACPCVAGRCNDGPPCGGQCADDEICYAAVDRCRPGVAQCAPGQAPVSTAPASELGPLCVPGDGEIECVQAPAIRPADFGRGAVMALIEGAPVFAAYDADFGDLVYVEGVEAGAPRVTYLDGVPADGSVRADPDGPRGGVTTPGPDRGRYLDMTVDPKRRPHIVYYDSDARTLRYIRGDGEGGWGRSFVIDADGDVGRYPRIRTDAAGRAHIVYTAVRSGAGESGLRYAFSDAIDPVEGDFEVRDISTRPAPAEVAEPGVTPRVHGVMPCLHVGRDGRVYMAFYDAAEGWLYLAEGTPGGFIVSRMDGDFGPNWPADPGERYTRFEEHDVGRFCDLVTDSVVQANVVFLDADTNALLMYRGPFQGGGTLELVDPGGRGLRRLVGGDPAIALDANERPVVVYQDGTDNDLLMTVRNEEGWAGSPIVAASAGAVGFANSLVVLESTAVIGTLELATQAGGRGAHRLHVFRLDVPRF